MLKATLILFFASLLVLAQQQNDFNNKYMLAQSFLQGGQYDKAKQLFEELQKTQPDNYQAFNGLNNCYIQLKQYESSIALIENRIKIYPQDINLYGLLGSTYYLTGNDKKAFEVWDSSVDKIPNKDISYRILANYAIERRAFDKAIEYLRKGKAASQDKKYFSYDLANLYSLTMQFKKAAEEYCSIIADQPAQLTAIQGRIFAFINKPGALEQTISVVREWENKKIEFKYLLAALYKEAKDYDKAYDLYNKIEQEQNRQGYELIIFANYLMGEKQYSKAAEVYSQIISHFPGSPFISNAKLGYAKTLEASLNDDSTLTSNDWKPFSSRLVSAADKIDKVIKAFSDITRLYPNSEIANEAFFRIANLVLKRKNDPAEAEKYFNKVISASPSSPLVFDAYISLGNIFIQQGNLDQAVLEFSKIIENKKSPLDKKNLARFGLAKISFYKNDFDKAKNILAEIINDPGDNSANDALQLSLLLNTAKNDSADLADFSKAELFAEQKKFNKAAELYKKIAENPQAFILSSLAKVRDAEMDLAIDSLDTAIFKLSKIAGENGKNIYADKALYLEAKTYQYGLKNIPKAIEAYESLLAKFPNSIYLNEARKIIVFLKNKLS